MNVYWYSIHWGFKPRLNKRRMPQIFRGNVSSGNLGANTPRRI
ncbi:hypothetical protein [Siminovitchia terrae]|nr:hypothetical protein [Siminovitchia terrae]